MFPFPSFQDIILCHEAWQFLLLENQQQRIKSVLIWYSWVAFDGEIKLSLWIPRADTCKGVIKVRLTLPKLLETFYQQMHGMNRTQGAQLLQYFLALQNLATFETLTMTFWGRTQKGLGRRSILIAKHLYQRFSLDAAVTNYRKIYFSVHYAFLCPFTLLVLLHSYIAGQRKKG